MFGDQAVVASRASSRRLAYPCFILGGLILLCVLAWILTYEPTHRPWLFSHSYPLVGLDFLGRMFEVNGVRTGQNIYFPISHEGFTYPPAAIILFLPFTYMPFETAFFTWTLVSILCLGATYLVVLRVARSNSWSKDIAIATWACVLTVVLFPPMQSSLAWGQTSTILLLLLTIDVLALRDRSQGVLVGVATALKLYPGVVIFYWLARRQWRPAITASVTFLLVSTISWMLWARSASYFFFHLLLDDREVDLFERLRDVDISSAPMSFFLRMGFLPHSVAVEFGVATSLAILVVGIVVAARLARIGYRVTALVTIVCTSVLVSPVAWDHYFTFAPLLVFVIMEVGLGSVPGKIAAISLALFTFPWLAFKEQVVHPTLVRDLLTAASENALFVAALLAIASAALAARKSWVDKDPVLGGGWPSKAPRVATTTKRAADQDRTGIISLEDRSSHFANQVLETTFQVKAAFAQR